MIVASPTSLPKPERIAVYDFVVEANDVSPNNAPLSRLMRAVGSSQTADQLKTGRSVANTLSVELVTALKDLQLPVERGARRWWRIARSPSKGNSFRSTRETGSDGWRSDSALERAT